jgi:beta-N-acetylhexosaminidase
LEEKAGQVLMVHFHGQEANEEARRLIEEVHIGGIIYYNWSNELKNPQQVQNLSQGLQQLARQTPHALPLLIAVDQEGGRVSRLKQGFTTFPGNYALGQTGEWQWGKESAWIIGQELKVVGISLNLAPVVDVYTQPENPVIGIRAFSSNATQVALWGKYVLQGYQQAGVIAALKHFPGHGDVKVDSHEALPVVAKKRALLEQVELLPFRTLASQADVIMTGHLLVPALDNQQCVTFSKSIVNDLLREEFNFQGVIMTDSLAMEGVLSQCSSIEEAVLKSLEAGHDLILLGGKQMLISQIGLEFTVEDVRRIHHFIVDAVKQGRLSEKRLDDAVARLIALKKKYGLFDSKQLEPSLLKTHIYTAAHRAFAQQIARKALQLVQGDDLLPLSFQSESVLIVAPDCLRDDLTQTVWNSLGPHVQILYFKGLNPDQAAIQEIHATAKKATQCLYFAYNTWQYLGQRELFQSLTQIFPRTIALAVRDPLDAKNLTTAQVVLCTFSPVACSLQAAFDYLTEKR